MTNDFYDFGTGPDEVVEPAPEDPRIQWFHRRNFCDTAGKTKGLTVGWHSQQGKHEEWDMACLEAGFRIIHLKQDEKIVPYWQLNSSIEGGNEDLWGSASPFILAKGCPSEQEMMSSPLNRVGIAYGWGKNRAGEPRKIMKFRGMLPEIYDKPVVFVVGGMGMVGFLLQALGRDGHYRVLRANNARLQEKGLTTRTPYWGFRLTLLPGDDVSVKGRKGSSEVTKIVTDIPAEITAEFLASHHVGEYRELVQNDIRENGFSIEWSLKTSQSIEAGTDESAKESNGHAEISPSIEENYDHPFDIGDDPDPDEAHREWRVEQERTAKPVAKPVPSNSLKPMSDSELSKIVGGTANVAQRRALQRLGRIALAQKAELSKEEAGKEIAAAQKRH